MWMLPVELFVMAPELGYLVSAFAIVAWIESVDSVQARTGGREVFSSRDGESWMRVVLTLHFSSNDIEEHAVD